jgi:hypothetical protein
MLPNLIIIGGKKCGTTSLHHYLSLHPQISMAWEKEIHFFVGTERWHRGTKWYESRFPGANRIVGEASPSYTNYPVIPNVPQRMRAVIPDAKLIYLVRDPIETMISHYVHRYANNKIDDSLQDVLATFEGNEIVDRCRYYYQLEQYFPYFPREQILVVQTEQFYAQRQQTMQHIFTFLGVDASFTSPNFARLLNEGRRKRRKTRLGRYLARLPLIRQMESLPFRVQSRINETIFYPFSSPVIRPQMDHEIRQRLIEHLREDVCKLREYTGQKLEGWSL